MANDVLKQVRDEILEEDKKHLPWVPKHLDKTWEHQAGIAGAIIGAFGGATIGSHVGLALGPLGAINGAIPGAIIGGALGYFGAAKVGTQVQRDKPAFLKTTQYKQLDTGVGTQVKQIESDDKYSNKSSGLPKLVVNDQGNRLIPNLYVCYICGKNKPLWWDKNNRCSVCYDNENKKTT